MGNKLEISDEILWGKLVKSWATGRNYIVQGGAVPKIPRTMDELQAQATDIGLTIRFPDGMTGLAVISYSPHTVVLKLPPKSMVEETEQELQAGNSYPWPAMYDNFYNAPLPAMDLAKRMDLHAARIGDYSIRNCG